MERKLEEKVEELLEWLVDEFVIDDMSDELAEMERILRESELVRRVIDRLRDQILDYQYKLDRIQEHVSEIWKELNDF